MTRLRKIKAAAVKLYRCERGAETIEKLLIIGAIVLPLLIALVYFRDAISEWVGDKWEDVSDTDDPTIVP